MTHLQWSICLILTGALVPCAWSMDQLEPINIQGGGINTSDQPGTIPITDHHLGTAISGEMLETIPGAGGDPLRALTSFPGITVNDDSSAAPAIRGSRPGDNHYEVDFLPAGYMFHSHGAISTFNGNLIQAMDLYPSAYSSEFSGASGAVIDVKLRTPKTDRVHTQLDASFLHAGLLVEGPIKPGQSAYFAGRISYLDLLLKDQLDTDDDGLTFEQFPAYSDYQGKYLWELPNNAELKLQINGATDKESILIDATNKDISNEPDLIGKHASDTKYHTQGLVWERPLDSGVHLKSAISHSSSSTDEEVGNAGALKFDTEKYAIKTHLTYPLNSFHELKTGLEIQHRQLNYDVSFKDTNCTEFDTDCTLFRQPTLSSKSKLNFNTYHVFLRDAWFPTDKLTVHSGLVIHGDDYLEKTLVEPRLSLEYALADGWLLSTGAGIYHQLPSFGSIEKVFGNPNLDYIKSTHAVAGIERIFNNGWKWKSELYYKNYDDLITGHDVTRYSNDGEGSAYGLETLVQKSVTDKLSGWLAVTLSKAEREHSITKQSFVFDYDQPVNIQLVGKYTFSPRWTLGGKWSYHSGSPNTKILGGIQDPDDPRRFDAVYGDINAERLSAYNRLDLRIDRHFDVSWGKLSGYFELLNALNNKNIQGYDYNHDYSQRTAINQLPRIISLGVKAEF